MADITWRRETLGKRYAHNSGHRLQEDFINYMDQLASLARMKPTLLLLLFTDPKLPLKVFFGPCTSYQCHLQGPGKWGGARKAMTQRERILKPMQTQIVNKDIHRSHKPAWLRFLCVGIAFSMFVLPCF
uniref:Flavin-containing monooxygenase n=1 Tax=Monodelphis domestica TaxID=13616 RepID=K7E1K6_MONDO